MFQRNPLDTSGIICDFCARPGAVVHMYQTAPFMLGSVLRSQFMACAACRDLIQAKNLRALVTQAANLVGQPMRRAARLHFNSIYSQFFNNLQGDTPIQPSHIFDLHVLRAAQKHQKCQFRLKPDCTDLAFVLLNENGWKPACVPCAMQMLGSQDPAFIVNHPKIRTLRRNPDPDPEDEWEAARREGEKEYIKEWGGLCEKCDDYLRVCDVCDVVVCSCHPCECQTKKRRNPDEELRRLERGIAIDDSIREKLHRTRHRSGLPIHDHDCEQCVYLASVDPDARSGQGCQLLGKDLYICPSKSMGGSMIVRFSCQDSDYSSMPLDVFLSRVNDPDWQKLEGQRRNFELIFRLARQRGLA